MKKLPVAGPTYDYKLENIRNSIIEEELALTHRKLENIELGDGDVIFTDDSGNQKTVRTLQTTIDDPSTGLTATASAVSSLSTDVSTLDGEVTSLASSVTTLSTTVGSNTTSISTNASSINGIEGKYAVKIDNNGHVSGFGLISTANNAAISGDGISGAATTSTFTIAADAFKIVDTSGSATPAAPFEVYTSSRTVDGVTVPAGVYMENANITSAQIKTLSVDLINIDNVTLDTSGGNLIVKSGGIDTTQVAADALSASASAYTSSASVTTSGGNALTTSVLASSGERFLIIGRVASITTTTTSHYLDQAFLYLNSASTAYVYDINSGTSSNTKGGFTVAGVITATGSGSLPVDFYMRASGGTITCNNVFINIIRLKR